MKEAQVDTIQDFQKYVCLVFDEVRVKEGLVYDKHSLQVIGFVNLGDINNQLLKFERAQTSNSQETITPPIVKYMLVFMVHGIFSKLEFPYVRFSCANDVVFPLVWECIKQLETCGLKVIATTADGASVNRSKCTSRHLAKMVRWCTRRSMCIVRKSAPFSSYPMYPTWLKPFATAGVIHLHTHKHEHWR